MKQDRIPFSYSFLICLLSVFLIAAGLSRYIETESGNILIHDIDAESWEGFIYGARLYRPLQANSLNQRPAILLIAGDAADRYTCDHIAMELARRGFVALSMEDFSQGMTGAEPDFETENLVDAGYEFLNTRSFTDHTRIGLAVFFSGTEKAEAAKALPEFAAKVFISPSSESAALAPNDTIIFTAAYESSPEYRLTGITEKQIHFYRASHAEMLINSAVIADLLEQFHETLAIPDDTPFWFDSGSQRAPLLIGLRFLMLIILAVITLGLSTRLTAGEGISVLKIIMGIIIPLFFFQITAEVMNFYLVSVRIGSPFHYLPRLRQLQERFSPVVFALFITASLLWCIPLRLNGKMVHAADLFAAGSLIVCLIGFIPVLICGKSGWEFMGIFHQRWFFALLAFYACFDSLLLRMVPDRKRSLICASFVTGIMFYIICSCLPAALIIQERMI